MAADADRYDDSLVTDGRLAFYLKAKLKGKYLLTAQADTREREISDLFTDFWRADPQDIFRRLDPDAYYPVYGDDSTTYRDVDTMGRLYLRMDWDKSQALWGNYNTGITGTEYGQYSRALYGAALSWRSRGSNAWGDPGSELKVFGSEAQTAPGHSEFLGTGGSLYYLKNTDVLPGSERVAIEVRDPTTGRVMQRIELHPGADYEIDNMQGRIILTNPLARVTRDGLPGITFHVPFQVRPSIQAPQHPDALVDGLCGLSCQCIAHPRDEVAARYRVPTTAASCQPLDPSAQLVADTPQGAFRHAGTPHQFKLELTAPRTVLTLSTCH